MSERGHEIFGIDRRNAILTGIAALVLAVAAVVGIGQITSLHHVVRALGRGDHSWFPVCLAGALIAYAGYVAAYRDVARFDGGPYLGVWMTLRIVVIGFGAVLIGSELRDGLHACPGGQCRREHSALLTTQHRALVHECAHASSEAQRGEATRGPAHVTDLG